MKTECSSFFISTADRFLMLPSPVLWTESSRCQWQWKLFFLQVVGMVATVHWCIMCSIAGCWRADKMCSLSPSPLCTGPLKGTLCDRSVSRLLKWAHLWTHTHTHMHTCPVRVTFSLAASALVILCCRRLFRYLRGSRHTRSRQSRGGNLQSAQQSSLHLRSGTHAVRLCREDLLPQWDLVGETAVLQM